MVARDEHRSDAGARGERLSDRDGPFEEVGARGVPVAAAPELARREDPGVLEAGEELRYEGAFSSDCRATSASAVNVAGSLTASSASILRSTSTSAAFRPAINRE